MMMELVPLSLVEVTRIGGSGIDVAGVSTVFGVPGVPGVFSIRPIKHQVKQARIMKFS
jgi:hypothetical protein